MNGIGFHIRRLAGSTKARKLVFPGYDLIDVASFYCVLKSDGRVQTLHAVQRWTSGLEQAQTEQRCAVSLNDFPTLWAVKLSRQNPGRYFY